MRSRVAAFTALFNLCAGAYAWKTPPSLTAKFVLWDGVAPSLRPAMFLFDGGNEQYNWTSGAVPRRTIQPRLFAYFDASAVQQSPTIDAVLDALDAGLHPSPVTGKADLGGTCEYCRVFEVEKAPGDLDGDGLLMVTFNVVLP